MGGARLKNFLFFDFDLLSRAVKGLDSPHLQADKLARTVS